MLARLGRRWQAATADVGTWLGHRVVFVDGSGCSMPDAGPLRDHYGRPPGQAEGCGFPVARLLGVVHAGTGLILEWLDARSGHDRASKGRRSGSAGARDPGAAAPGRRLEMISAPERAW